MHEKQDFLALMMNIAKVSGLAAEGTNHPRPWVGRGRRSSAGMGRTLAALGPGSSSGQGTHSGAGEVGERNVDEDRVR